MKNAFKLAANLSLVFVLCGCGHGDKQAANVNTLQCASNLRTIKAVKANWAEQSGANSNTVPTWDDLAQYLRHGSPECPDGGTYTIGPVGQLPACSIAAHNAYFNDHVEAQP